MSKEFLEATNELRSFMFKNVYLDSAAKKEEVKTQNILSELYCYIVKSPELLPHDMKKLLDTYDIHKVVCDYIAGMTDRYAVKKFHDIFIPSSWTY
jgi:dGTPase